MSRQDLFAALKIATSACGSAEAKIAPRRGCFSKLIICALFFASLFFASLHGYAQPATTGSGAPDPLAVDTVSGHPRVIVLSDIGNEPDDQMSLTRFLLYSDEFDVEALIASTSTWQKTVTHPETMHALVKAYGSVRENLLKHAQGWPTEEALDARITSGQPGYGIAAVGPGMSSPGSKAIIAAADREDSRPLWITIWGGSNTLAQALDTAEGATA